MLFEWTRRTVLNVVYRLGKNDAQTEAYKEGLRIFQQALDDKEAGVNPADRMRCVSGRIVLNESTGDCRGKQTERG